MRVLRISHSAVVDAWRERERELRERGVDVSLLCARAWDEGGRTVPLEPRDGEDVAPVRTWGSHPAVFVFSPGPLFRALGRAHDVLDVHEEPYALATAQILALRWLRRRWDRTRGRAVGPPAPVVLYSAQNIAKRYPPPFRWFERAALRRAAAIQVCNDEAGRVLRSKGARGVIETIPLGVGLPPDDRGDTHDQGAPDGQEGAGPAPSGGVVGYAGRLETHKGVDLLLEAVATDPRLELRIAGGGPELERLRDRAARADLAGRVAFVGALDATALRTFYRSLDVLAVPSRVTPGWVEQFGRVAVEAMAHDVPVVAAATGALPDVVGGVGLLVEPDDPQALAVALRRVVDSPQLARRMRAAGRRRAARCSWPAVAARLHHLYGTVLGTTGPALVPDPPEVVVVAYGSPDLLCRALEPVAGALPVTIVDNGSDRRVAAIAERVGARYLDPGRNGGFAAGVNHGLAHRQHPGRDVLLLNPDAVISAAEVLTLQRTLRAHPRTASVGPAQTDGAGQPSRVEWPFPRPSAAWAEALGVDAARRALGRPAPAQRHGTYVIGSVLLLRAEALDDVGPFDEDFFLYAEETDWAYRAHLRGWRHRLEPAVTATHLGGATSGDPLRREAWVRTSMEHYWRKHYGTAGWVSARTAGVLGASVRSVAQRGDAGRAARRRLTRLLREAPA